MKSIVHELNFPQIPPFQTQHIAMYGCVAFRTAVSAQLTAEVINPSLLGGVITPGPEWILSKGREAFNYETKQKFRKNSANLSPTMRMVKSRPPSKELG